MAYSRSLIVGLAVSQGIAAAVMGGGHTDANEIRAPVHRSQKVSGGSMIKESRPVVTPLDRVTIAVDGAESSHGTDIGMWRADPSGPQGPMQVSEAAATDVGGGDRFDLTQNRAIGRAYLAQLYGRYRNWPEAIAAYNWGRGNMDAWIRAGRPPEGFLLGVAVYLKRVLHESGLCENSKVPPIAAKRAMDGRPSAMFRHHSGEFELTEEAVVRSQDPSVSAACLAREDWLTTRPTGVASNRFAKKLDQALQLATQRMREDP
jgi:Transglycosylase SLT domain